MEDPLAAYNRLDTSRWLERLQAELRTSGLPEVIRGLTNEMVDIAQGNTLLSEADAVIKQLREMRIVYECVLLRYDIPSVD